MKIQTTNQILIKKTLFTGTTAPVKPFEPTNNQRGLLKNQQLKNLSAAYFHPSFCSNPAKIKAFEKFMESLLENPQTLNEETEKKLISLFKQAAKASRKNYINRGAIGKVYRISDKYVFKIESDLKRLASKSSDCKINAQDRYKNLDVYYGGELATIGKATILKNADPEKKAIAIGTPINKFIFEWNEHRYYKKHGFAQKIAAMPQKAFDKIAQNFNTLNKEKNNQRDHYFGFDFYNPNNFLLVGDEIRITDALDDLTEPNQNNIGGMLTAFLTQTSAFVSSEPSAELVPFRKEILKKCILATEKAKLPLEWGSYDEGIVNRALELCNTKLSQNALLKQLKAFRVNIPDEEIRLAAINKYLDNMDS